MKKIFQFLRDIKIKYKLFLIFGLLIYILINSWILSFTTVSDVEDSFLELESKAFPTLEATISLKDNLERSFTAVYDYILTNDPANKEVYDKNFQEAILDELTLFEVGYTEEDFEFTQSFNDQLVNINNQLDELIVAYEANSDSPEVNAKIKETIQTKEDFNKFIDTEISQKVSNEIQTASNNIGNTAERITLYLFIVLGGVVIIVILLVIFISTNITRPINKLIHAAREFGKGNLTPVNLKRKDELGEFADTFNKMAVNINKTQKALEVELEKTKELDKQKSEFVSFAAHQLRTPMAGIKWVINMFYSGEFGKMNADQKHFLGRAVENSDRMIKLINSLLDITQIEEQKFQYKFEKHDYLSLVKEVIKEQDHEAQKRDVSVIIKKEKDLKSEMVMDIEKLKMSLTNLIDNAIKYSNKNGKVEILIEKKGSMLHTEIRDYGLGIPKKEQEKMFTKFFRGNNVLKMETQGSGLGVFIAKDIIDKHGGKISFTSEENKGTTFFIDLPYSQKK
ncbi:HAMP domain-containing protein [Patescibacteria group bacterium]|nr:HAMP domain-containing protein [Patescibacteria group bacterium]